MKKTPIFPLTGTTFMVVVCTIAATIFVLIFFLSPPPPVFNHTMTVQGKVEAIFPAGGRFHTNEAPISVKLEDGSVITFKVSTRQRIFLGESVEVDILTTEGKRPRYRLAQDPIQP